METISNQRVIEITLGLMKLQKKYILDSSATVPDQLLKQCTEVSSIEYQKIRNYFLNEQALESDEIDVIGCSVFKVIILNQYSKWTGTILDYIDWAFEDDLKPAKVSRQEVHYVLSNLLNAN